MQRLTLATLVSLTFLATTACGDDPNAVAGPTAIPTSSAVDRVSIAGTPQGAIGQTWTLKAMATMNDGSSRDVSSEAFWRSTNTFVCEVSAGGVVIGTHAGICDVSVAFNDKTALLKVTVVSTDPNGTGAPVGTIDVRGPRTLFTGQGDRFQVIATNADGSQRDVTGSATFTSSNTAVADTDRDGRVGARSPGTTTITVAANGSQTSFPLTVTPAPPGGGGGGTGGGGTGTGPGGGTNTGGGTSTGGSNVIGLDVTGGVTLAPGQLVQLSVVARREDGSTQDVTAVSAFSSNNPLLSVNGSGVLSAIGALPELLLSPDALITVSYGGATAGIPVRVALR